MDHIMKNILTAIIVALSFAAYAQGGHDHGHAASAAKSGAAGDVSTGEVKRINQETKKITIAHGPLKAFDMPSMTMAFGVKDPTMLGKVKQGDKVKFVLEKVGEDLVIAHIEAAR